MNSVGIEFQWSDKNSLMEYVCFASAARYEARAAIFL